MHHFLWHEVRNNWMNYPEDVQWKLKDKGWEPPRPALDDKGHPILINQSGEDFLYMHRQMIAFVNGILAQVADPGYPQVVGWLRIPAPGDPEFPVPSAWFDPNNPAFFPILQKVKSNTYFEKSFLLWERMYTDSGFLKGMDLGELGARIEWTVHNQMHNRWSANPGASRPDPDPTLPDSIPKDWDDPRYDYLGDTYSSHVNQLFWKLHGWVDDRIEAWKTVNGVFGDDFWKGTWMGPMPDGMAGAPKVLHGMLADSAFSTDHLEQLEEVAKLIARHIFFKPFHSPL